MSIPLLYAIVLMWLVFIAVFYCFTQGMFDIDVINPDTVIKTLMGLMTANIVATVVIARIATRAGSDDADHAPSLKKVYLDG